MEITLIDGVKILVLNASIYNTLSKTERDELMVKYGCTKVQKSDTETSTRSADHITPEMINWRNGMQQDFNKQTSGTKFMIGVDGYKYVPQLTFRKSGKNPASAAEITLVDNLAGLGKDKTTK